MNIFIPNEKHIAILNEIGRWKVIGLKDLFTIVGGETLYSPFCKTLRKLEHEGLVQSFSGDRRKKYLSLSYEGGRFSKFSSPYIESTNELRHDLITSCALRELLKYENFKSGHVMLEDLDVVPDAVIYASKQEKEYSLALEIELTQKSRKRLIDKFSRYSNSSIFNYVLYVTNKRSLFDSYRKLICEMNSHIQGRLMILLNETMKEHEFEYLTSPVWFKGEQKSFQDIFA